ncbi:hypothetical protein KC315_g443 [Hortaea werneckii]|nr:hypothetical protein KC342_g1364 [Hortaea werneckii]KAI7097971.1 hypothetical protein KC339_g9318 [Hortaea werneckii]KAI7225365.1 hypothetical protein KC365_g10023 [Hortaea werneckii]KAI7318264.1 hypothetical protein KC340_g8112 [Hortaea werneckii]KAI7340866.1 hypothetical protein KC315_g443 [Hortaea werneckii]
MTVQPEQEEASRHLSVAIKAVSSSPPTIAASISNQHSTKVITVLGWDTPFDPTALNSGALQLYRITSSGSNAAESVEIPGPGMKVNRLLPPPREDLIELKPGASVERHVTLKAPWIPADGQDYRLRFRGQWRGLWPKATGDISAQDLEQLGGVTGQSYETETVEMKLE